jgi:hypothetical protein
MLKIYQVHNYVSIDGADWREVVSGFLADCQCIALESCEIKYALLNRTFDDVRECLKNHRLDGIWNDTTFWTRKPIICVRYADAYNDVEYKHFKSLSYMQTYEEWRDVSLEWIIKHLSAEQAIQYLKERGITTCPMNF